MKIAYVHPRQYPSLEVNALQALRMASAFAEKSDTTFFTPRLHGTINNLKLIYDIPGSPLKIRPMLFNYVPDRILIKQRNYFERAVSQYLSLHPKWKSHAGQKVLFVRDPRELLYWGRQKAINPKFKDWLFIYEAHSTIGLRPNEASDHPIFISENEVEAQYQNDILAALKGFDIVICVTQAMTDALLEWTDDSVKPFLVRHASPLPRSAVPPNIHFGDKITLGYIGQISQYKGVKFLLDAMKHLPEHITLKIVGRFVEEENVASDWLRNYTEDPLLCGRIEIREPVPIAAVANEIDSCDIMIQTASSAVRNARFEAPLKSFDYMVRGKPIIAADVPCHRELYGEGINALLYKLDAAHLAKQISRLVNDVVLAQKIAHGAWAQSVDYSYSRRAETILTIIENTRLA